MYSISKTVRGLKDKKTEKEPQLLTAVQQIIKNESSRQGKGPIHFNCPDLGMIVSVFPPQYIKVPPLFPTPSITQITNLFKNFANLVRNIQCYVYLYCSISMEGLPWWRSG